MQTTNTAQTRPTLAQASGFSKRSGIPLKSFGALADAITDKEIEAFALNIRQGIDHWRTAGKLLVTMTERHPEAMQRIREKTGLSESVLQTFARIGRNEIWPPLLVDSSLGARKLLECNYDEQKKYAEEPIDVAVSWKAGEIKTVKKKVSELTRAEVASVFSDGSINTLEQQAWRLRTGVEKLKPLLPTDPAPAYAAPRKVNVDIGYFSIMQHPDGRVTCEPCGRSAMAQPVRVLPNSQGFKSAIMVLYQQETI